jgi:hypothetical protein
MKRTTLTRLAKTGEITSRPQRAAIVDKRTDKWEWADEPQWMHIAMVQLPSGTTVTVEYHNNGIAIFSCVLDGAHHRTSVRHNATSDAASLSDKAICAAAAAFLRRIKAMERKR